MVSEERKIKILNDVKKEFNKQERISMAIDLCNGDFIFIKTIQSTRDHKNIWLDLVANPNNTKRYDGSGSIRKYDMTNYDLDKLMISVANLIDRSNYYEEKFLKNFYGKTF